MRLHEAIETGRPFRRAIWRDDEGMWCRVAPDDNGDPIVEFVTGRDRRFYTLTADLCADDWEVRPISVTITDRQFWDAYSAVLREEMESPFRLSMPTSSFVQRLAEKLGLEGGPKE